MEILICTRNWNILSSVCNTLLSYYNNVSFDVSKNDFSYFVLVYPKYGKYSHCIDSFSVLKIISKKGRRNRLANAINRYYKSTKKQIRKIMINKSYCTNGSRNKSLRGKNTTSGAYEKKLFLYFARNRTENWNVQQTKFSQKDQLIYILPSSKDLKAKFIKLNDI